MKPYALYVPASGDVVVVTYDLQRSAASTSVVTSTYMILDSEQMQVLGPTGTPVNVDLHGISTDAWWIDEFIVSRGDDTIHHWVRDPGEHPLRIVV